MCCRFPSRWGFSQLNPQPELRELVQVFGGRVHCCARCAADDAQHIAGYHADAGHAHHYVYVWRRCLHSRQCRARLLELVSQSVYQSSFFACFVPKLLLDSYVGPPSSDSKTNTFVCCPGCASSLCSRTRRAPCSSTCLGTSLLRYHRGCVVGRVLLGVLLLIDRNGLVLVCFFTFFSSREKTNKQTN